MPDKRNRTDDAKAEADQGNYDRNSEPVSVMVHMENDMHYRVYGYYKKNCQQDQIPVFVY